MRWLTAVLVGMALATGWAAAAKAVSLLPDRNVPYRVISMEIFAAVPRNWDGESTTRTAVIRNREDWDEVFAPVAGEGCKSGSESKSKGRGVAPGEPWFEKEAFLVVIRITPPAPEGKENLSPCALLEPVANKDRRMFWYFCDEPEAKEGLLVKSVLMVAVPKDEVPADDKAITFTRVHRHQVDSTKKTEE